jgi:EKC/KEOPS complex subunit PCC1/LAGE3
MMMPSNHDALPDGGKVKTSYPRLNTPVAHAIAGRKASKLSATTIQHTHDQPPPNMATPETEDAFPCKLLVNLRQHDTRLIENRNISIPLLTSRLASIALRSLSVDKELSPLVQRSFTLLSPSNTEPGENLSLLNVSYSATTNRMLRVSVNGFWESLRLVVEVMEQLDEDVVENMDVIDLEGVQGVGEVAADV